MSFPLDKISENIVLEAGDSVLKSCPTCGRTFNPQSLERHVKICERSKKSNHRTVFNSFLQRAKEIGAVPVKPESKVKEKNRKKWPEEHESLTRVVKLGKNFQGELLNNGMSPQKSVPPGYQQCPSCERHFSEKAAERHISWCQEQRNRLPKTPTNAIALERLNARVKYRAPLPKKKNSLRLVKSAESLRESSSFRTYSSPSSRTHPRMDAPPLQLPPCKDKKVCNDDNNNSPSGSSIENVSKTKKAVKFKEMFPVHDKEKNRNLDMLAALRLRLSELSASDDTIDDYIPSPLSLSNHSKVQPFLPSEGGRESWGSEGEVSSDSAQLNRSLEHPIPRFCYNCGTKYPVMSAKYCCECGAQRFLFNALGDTRLSVP